MSTNGGANRARIRLITECAVAVALGAVLGAIELWRLPQGGSISFGFLPIIFIAHRRGVIAGAVSGVMLGVLQLFMGGTVIHPVQALLDYPLAYGFLGLAGLTRDYQASKKAATIINGVLALGLVVFIAVSRLDTSFLNRNPAFYYEFLELRLAVSLCVVALFIVLEQLKGNPVVLGVLIGGGARLAAHVAAGAIFFASSAPQGMNVLLFSFLYNISHVLPELIVACLLLPLLHRKTEHLGSV